MFTVQAEICILKERKVQFGTSTYNYLNDAIYLVTKYVELELLSFTPLIANVIHPTFHQSSFCIRKCTCQLFVNTVPLTVYDTDSQCAYFSYK